MIYYFYYFAEQGGVMNNKEKMELLKFAIQINLIVGMYNIALYAYGNTIFNLVIGSLNVGVWVFFRDMKIVEMILRKRHQ
tara:strand:+ start:197 stop:436 length:240 start_codon:yes stop_codon:yes gene_type:complete